MKLQTQLKLQPSQTQFGYEDKLLLLGSCFSENIGKKLEYYKFQSVTNPFGIIFNPVALERLIEDAVANKTYTEEDVFELEGVWKSYLAHSDLNATSRLQAVIHLQEAQQQLRTQFLEASHLFITLGTAWVYRSIGTNEVVANCHKVPQKEFKKELLSVAELRRSLSQIVEHAKTLNPAISITFTVSPVRHIKDGIVENARSKSHLISAVHELVDSHNLSYFPSYELMMDELRDYRFYASDMLHPSEQAIDYIWKKFVEVYAFAKAQDTLKKVSSIQNRLQHKPFNPASEKHKMFMQKLDNDIAHFISEHPFINF